MVLSQRQWYQECGTGLNTNTLCNECRIVAAAFLVVPETDDVSDTYLWLQQRRAVAKPKLKTRDAASLGTLATYLTSSSLGWHLMFSRKLFVGAD